MSSSSAKVVVHKLPSANSVNRSTVSRSSLGAHQLPRTRSILKTKSCRTVIENEAGASPTAKSEYTVVSLDVPRSSVSFSPTVDADRYSESKKKHVFRGKCPVTFNTYNRIGKIFKSSSFGF